MKKSSHWLVFVLLLTVCLAPLSPAQANDVVKLGEVLPSVRGTALESVPVGQAPPAGSSRSVRRRELRAALKRAGVDPKSLDLPRAVTVSRKAKDLSEEEVLALVDGTVRDAFTPCDVLDLQTQHRTRVAAGDLHAYIERRPMLRSGRVTVMVTLASGSGEVRVPVTANLQCPPPAVTSGSVVQMVVRVGAVKASASGIALQTGRVGETVRVRNAQTNTTLTALVVDAQRVEVLR